MPQHKLQTLTSAHIISLIRDDLINYKLVSSLNDLGLNAHDYFLRLSETIFELVGIDERESDTIFESYLLQLKKVKKLPLKKSAAGLDLLAASIYKDLLMKASGSYSKK
jgi:hypothetical protein